MKWPAAGELTLGFHATSHGFGWVAFSSPLTIYDFGTCESRSEKNATCLRRLERLLIKLEPHTLVMEVYEGPTVRRSDRVVRLCKAVSVLAQSRGIDVAIFSRDDIRGAFGAVGATTRQEIAEAVARSFEVLRHKLPTPRLAWEGSQRRMALFDAAAAVLAHFQLEARHLLCEGI
jgi:Holliday junction resolvasome RuvABC endonuclease subunit